MENTRRTRYDISNGPQVYYKKEKFIYSCSGIGGRCAHYTENGCAYHNLDIPNPAKTPDWCELKESIHNDFGNYVPAALKVQNGKRH